MKKMIVVCFAFMFLLAVVAGCPQAPKGESKSDGGSKTAVESGGSESSTLVSSDESSGDDIAL